MEEGDERCVLEEHGSDVIEYRATRHGVELVANRVLHPRIRSQDEEGGEQGADRRGPDGREVHAFRQAVPAEDPQAEECRLEEEGEQALHGERRPEYVADES